jgi:hypothetical protein
LESIEELVPRVLQAKFSTVWEAIDDVIGGVATLQDTAEDLVANFATFQGTFGDIVINVDTLQDMANTVVAKKRCNVSGHG